MTEKMKTVGTQSQLHLPYYNQLQVHALLSYQDMYKGQIACKDVSIKTRGKCKTSNVEIIFLKKKKKAESKVDLLSSEHLFNI